MHNSQDCLLNWLPKVIATISVEEHFRTGGLGSLILEILNDNLDTNSVNFIDTIRSFYCL